MIKVFNMGKHKEVYLHRRCVNNLYQILKKSNKINTLETPVVNIGNPKTITLTKFISILEKKTLKKIN